MTLIAAIACEDGVVIASDSASSDSEIQTKLLVNKIRQIGNHPVLYAGSGDGGLLQKIDEVLKTFSPKDSIKRTRQELKKLILPELREAYQDHAPYPLFGFNLPPTAILLFVGVHNKQPWILEIEKDGRDTVFNEELGNFAAIGSGKHWAQAIFRPHLQTTRDLKLGKIFAYRVLEDSINIASANLAMPIDMYSIVSNGDVARINEDERKTMIETCELWRTLEREAVGKLLASQNKSVDDLEIPKPK